VLKPACAVRPALAKGTYDELFLSNYGLRQSQRPDDGASPGCQVLGGVFGGEQVRHPILGQSDTLAKLDITVNEIVRALRPRNTVNPAGQLGGKPVPRGQEFHLHGVGAAGWRGRGLRERRGQATPTDPSCGCETWRASSWASSPTTATPPHGRPAAGIAIYQLPASNAVETMKAATKLMERPRRDFRHDLDYVTALDTTLAVSAGIHEIVRRWSRRSCWWSSSYSSSSRGFRATLIPLLAVPVSLVGNVHGLPRSWLLDQHAVTLRWCWPSASWWTTPSWWSRRSSTTSKRGLSPP